MKTKIMKSTLVLLTALLLSMGLTACGGGGGGSSAPAGGGTTASGTTLSGTAQ